MPRFLDTVREALEPHEAVLLDSLWQVRSELIDEQASSIVRMPSFLRVEVVAIADECLRFEVVFSRPAGRYHFAVGPGVPFADWDRMATNDDAAERKYEVDGFLRSEIRVTTRRLPATQEPIDSEFVFSALTYGQGPHRWLYRYGYSWWRRCEVSGREYRSWVRDDPTTGAAP